MLWVKELLGTASWMANPSQPDPATGLLRLAHCTVPGRLVTSWELRSHFESGSGVALAGDLTAGPVTILRLEDEGSTSSSSPRARPSPPRAARTSAAPSSTSASTRASSPASSSGPSGTTFSSSRAAVRGVAAGLLGVGGRQLGDRGADALRGGSAPRRYGADGCFPRTPGAEPHQVDLVAGPPACAPLPQGQVSHRDSKSREARAPSGRPEKSSPRHHRVPRRYRSRPFSQCSRARRGSGARPLRQTRRRIRPPRRRSSSCPTRRRRRWTFSNASRSPRRQPDRGSP